MNDQWLMKILTDHERRISEIEEKLGIEKPDPTIQKVLENLLKGVEEQNARSE